MHFKDVDEQPKSKVQRVTAAMSPASKQRIMDARLEAKRVTSREWHAKYKSKGAL